MRKLIALQLLGFVFVPVLVSACGEPDPGERLEAACEKACDNLASAGCSEFPSSQQCRTQCPYLEQQLEGFCIEEYADLYECSANLQYTCMDGFPYPADPNAALVCNESSKALLECQQGLTCKKFCRAAVEAGCGGASEDACVKDCEAERPTDSFCEFDYDYLRECQTEDLTCDGDKPSTATCQSEEMQYQQCIAGN